MVGYIYKPHKDVVYLYILFNHGVAGNHLHGDGFLVKYEKIYPVGQAKPIQVPIKQND
jgi:hypothetical protein